MNVSGTHILLKSASAFNIGQLWRNEFANRDGTLTPIGLKLAIEDSLGEHLNPFEKNTSEHAEYERGWNAGYKE